MNGLRGGGTRFGGRGTYCFCRLVGFERASRGCQSVTRQGGVRALRHHWRRNRPRPGRLRIARHLTAFKQVSWPTPSSEDGPGEMRFMLRRSVTFGRRSKICRRYAQDSGPFAFDVSMRLRNSAFASAPRVTWTRTGFPASLPSVTGPAPTRPPPRVMRSGLAGSVDFLRQVVTDQ